jgi:hypothetical protein
MKIDELRKQCEDSNGHVYLVLFRSRNSRIGDKVRLGGSAGGPYGQVCNVQETGDGRLKVVAVFKSAAILKALDNL